jgi:hypothetical protein
MEGIRIMAAKTNASTGTANRPISRPTPSLERAIGLSPNAKQAEAIATSFGLEDVDFEDVMNGTAAALKTMDSALNGAMNERARQMHFERIVGAIVTSAVRAGEFYGEKLTAARDLTSKLANDDRDEDRDGVAGFESRAQRAREFAADTGLQAFALVAAANGAVNAYKDITGDEWKPFAGRDNGPGLGAQAAQAQMGAFG